MPRRPRPENRRPPKSVLENAAALKRNAKGQAAKAPSAPVVQQSLKRKRDDEEKEEEESDGGFFEDASDEKPRGMLRGNAVDEGDDDDDESDDDDEDIGFDGIDEDDLSEDDEEDAGLAMYEDDDMRDVGSADSADEGDDAGQLKKLRSNLSSLPLGLLAKAQNSLHQAESGSDAEDHSDDDSDSAPSEHGPGGKPVVKTGEKKVRKEIQHRSTKHAPTEATSKRPVPRLRSSLPSLAPQPRDPRFTTLSGTLSLPHVRQNYAFLSDVQSQEVGQLREAVKLAKRRLPSTPEEKRDEAEAELARLAGALKRAESVRESNTRQAHEASVLRKLKKEEMTKRAQGKGEWHMKRSEKKKVLLEAKFERLKEEGGQRAVGKALRKREKREGEKEKKSRPFVRGEAGEGRSEGREEEVRLDILGEAGLVVLVEVDLGVQGEADLEELGGEGEAEV
ncbi:DUF947-domain-containing protein [Dacryopinax primogenitus]|uniref:rRNA biogenesis protein RRP36 n=1 Tax=Dacryopinax primogenitus (strain DJM 731) TaxID=1858805 RepID=M5FNP9_DACPD|nr:DUF947-domain-containing protein [Dacryopinax primogenitus]EJT97780.1 DUF947-domain-containing protein [Dacryopinax primogenitus]